MEELVVPTLVSGSRLRTKKLLKAGIAQLVEHQLPKLRAASSNLVSRSDKKSPVTPGLF